MRLLLRLFLVIRQRRENTLIDTAGEKKISINTTMKSKLNERASLCIDLGLSS
jgi:hypothetical protein